MLSEFVVKKNRCLGSVHNTVRSHLVVCPAVMVIAFFLLCDNMKPDRLTNRNLYICTLQQTSQEFSRNEKLLATSVFLLFQLQTVPESIAHPFGDFVIAMGIGVKGNGIYK